MILSEFISGLPADWATAPIYRAGVELPNGKPACGKSPMGRAHQDNLAPKASLHYLNQAPDKFGAVGVFSGPRSNGLVILDIDANLGQIQKEHGADLGGAHVLSPRKNAGKWFFTVPQSLWTEISDVSLAASGKGFEVLWGRQAVLCGEYAKGGTYTPKGDFNALPDAPEWLLEHMRESFRIKQEGKSNKKLADSRYSLRSREERIVIAQSCLSVIPHQGRGSEDVWWRIGAAIHSELPGDDGLELWREWSRLDAEYSNDWEHGDPCADRWENFDSGKGIGFGSLVKLADEFDPERARFRRDGCEQLISEIEAQTLQVKTVRLSYEDVLSRGMEIYEGEEIGRMNYELHQLGLEAGYRDAAGVEKLLLDHMTQQAKGTGHAMTERASTKRDFLIPGLLPKPYSVLFFGTAGAGKSATAIALMKHVVDGIPFQLKNQSVPIEPGPVIYFNGDMSEQDFEEEFDLHEIKNQKDFYFEPDFNLYRRMQFVRTMNKIKPSMICIDSLSSCSGSKAGDENKAEFAQPIYWLNSSNGTLWPACTIVILHHAAKAGGARGSSAITAAVAEVWNIDYPKKDSGFSTDQRVITVGKSRINRQGETLIQTQEVDLTVSLYETERPQERQTRAGSVADRIVNRLQINGGWMSRVDLAADQLTGGSVAAVKKALQRLENRGVVEVKKEGQTKLYRALSRGGCVKGGQVPQNPVVERAERGDTSISPESKCPPFEGSAGAASASTEDLSHSPRAWDANHDEFWDS